MKAIVPQTAMPTAMAPDNRLTTLYNTHVLIPRLGPLSSQRYTRSYAKLMKDYAAAVEMVMAARDFQSRYGKPVALPTPPPPANVKDLRFSPVLNGASTYQKHYVSGLGSFAPARVVEKSRGIASAASPSSINPPVIKSVSSRSKTSSASTAIPMIDEAIRFDAASVWAPEAGKLLRDDPSIDISGDGRIVIPKASPELFIADAELAFRMNTWGNSKGNRIPASRLKEEITNAAQGFEISQILHGLAQPNVVIEDMLSAGLVNAGGVWLGKELAAAKDPIGILAAVLVKRTGRRTSSRDLKLAELMDQAASLLANIGLAANRFLDRINKDADLRLLVYGYLIWKVDLIGGIDPNGVPLPDDTGIIGSREWAFRRSERMNMKVGTPTLRGPFSTEAVSPNSELTLSESTLQEVARFSEQGSGRSATRGTTSGTLSSSTFRQALSNLSEEGINDENAFSQDSTLLDTLRERRREAVESALTQISSHNEQRSGEMSRQASAASRTYVTRGKDPRFATTEVAFQVAAPVEVEIQLEGVGLVWCPRINSPFLSLHRLILDHEREARAEYIAQNKVIDPVRPPEVYDTASFKKEIGVKGNCRQQTKSFSFEIPAQYLEWNFDVSASKVDFRNGNNGDYNWDEALNWDDLENWYAFFRSVSRNGNAVSGIAVLETTDPEFFNKGFLTFEIAMSRLTEESRSALAAYDADKQEAAAQRDAVEVRATQYARLRRDELIEQYESSYALREEAFARLMREVFQGGGPVEQISYWHEIIRSCIEWSSSSMRFEPGQIDSLNFPHLPPLHFMNATGIRFMLPILRTGEDTFLGAMEQGAGTYYRSSAEAVRNFVEGYRRRVEELKTTSPETLMLDAYTTELVLGRHFEAVLSAHPFAETP